MRGRPAEDKYTLAVRSVKCPKCGAAEGAQCTPATSAVVHPIRRRKAIEAGLWDPFKALQETDPQGQFYAGGAPLEALKGA